MKMGAKTVDPYTFENLIGEKIKTLPAGSNEDTYTFDNLVGSPIGSDQEISDQQAEAIERRVREDERRARRTRDRRKAALAEPALNRWLSSGSVLGDTLKGASEDLLSAPAAVIDVGKSALIAGAKIATTPAAFVAGKIASAADRIDTEQLKHNLRRGTRHVEDLSPEEEALIMAQEDEDVKEAVASWREVKKIQSMERKTTIVGRIRDGDMSLSDPRDFAVAKDVWKRWKAGDTQSMDEADLEILAAMKSEKKPSRPFDREAALVRRAAEKKRSQSPEQRQHQEFIDSSTVGDFFRGVKGTVVDNIVELPKLLGMGAVKGITDLAVTGAGLADLSNSGLSTQDAFAMRYLHSRQTDLKDRINERAKARLDAVEKKATRLDPDEIRFGPAKTLSDQEREVVLGQLIREEEAKLSSKERKLLSGAFSRRGMMRGELKSIQDAADLVVEESKSNPIVKTVATAVGHLAAQGPAIANVVRVAGPKVGMAMYGAIDGVLEGNPEVALMGGATGAGFGTVSGLASKVTNKVYKAMVEAGGFATIGQAARIAQGLGLDTHSAISDAILGAGMSFMGKGKRSTTKTMRAEIAKGYEAFKALDNAGFASIKGRDLPIKPAVKGRVNPVERFEYTKDGKSFEYNKDIHQVVSEIKNVSGGVLVRDRATGEMFDLVKTKVPDELFLPNEPKAYAREISKEAKLDAWIERELALSRNKTTDNFPALKDKMLADIQVATQLPILNLKTKSLEAIGELGMDGYTKGIMAPHQILRHGLRGGVPKFGKNTTKALDAVNLALELPEYKNLDSYVADLAKIGRGDVVNLIHQAQQVINPGNSKKYQVLNKIYQDLNASYAAYGKRGLDAGVLNSLRDKYARHLWEGQERVDFSKKRTHTNILDGIIEGKKLAVSDAIQNWSEYATSMESAIHTRKFYERGRQIVMEQPDGTHTKLFTTNPNEVLLGDATDFSPQRLVAMENNPKVRVKVTEPTYSASGDVIAQGKTEYFRRLENYKELSKNVVIGMTGESGKGRGTESTLGSPGIEPGSKMYAKLYAPKEVAKQIERLFGSAVKTPARRRFDAINAARKHALLFFSLFHRRAIATSYVFGVGKKQKPGDNNPFSRRPIEAGHAAIREAGPAIELLIREGQLTYGGGAPEAFNKDMLTAKTKLGRGAQIARLAHEHRLFDIAQTGLKANGAITELYNVMRENPRLNPSEAARIVGGLMNADFGGLPYRSMGIHPNGLAWSRRALLAVDWTLSNFISAMKGLPGSEVLHHKKFSPKGKLSEGFLVPRKEGGRRILTPETKFERQQYSKFWGRIALKGFAVTSIANLLLNGGDVEEIWDNYKKAWKKGNLRVTKVDITNLAKWLGTSDGRKRYWSAFGHFMDPVKWAKSFINDATSPLRHKGSIGFRNLYEFATDRDWRGMSFTDLGELLRTQKTSSFRAKSGMSPNKYISFILHTLKEGLPIPLQESIKVGTGEVQALDAILKAGFGLPTSVDFKRRRR